jgi:hypothetical protein
MRQLRFYVVIFLVAVSPDLACAETVTERLIAESDPAIQTQISAVFNSRSEVEAFQKLEVLKKITDDKAELIKQLAIFSVTAPKKEEFHVLQTGGVLHQLETQFAWQGTTVIRILAPYLDSENQDLRDFVRLWFHTHDSNDRIHGKPPLGSVNYHEYMEYVRARLGRKEEIPTGFIEYIYEKHPGKALLVFAKAMGVENTVSQLQAMREAFDARRQGKGSPEEILQHQNKKIQQAQANQVPVNRRELKSFSLSTSLATPSGSKKMAWPVVSSRPCPKPNRNSPNSPNTTNGGRDFMWLTSCADTVNCGFRMCSKSSRRILTLLSVKRRRARKKQSRNKTMLPPRHSLHLEMLNQEPSAKQKFWWNGLPPKVQRAIPFSAGARIQKRSSPRSPPA